MSFEPKLTVILHADVVSSTELVQRDERAAHDRIQAAFRALADLVETHGGQVHELRGDAALAEFSRSLLDIFIHDDTAKGLF